MATIEQIEALLDRMLTPIIATLSRIQADLATLTRDVAVITKKSDSSFAMANNSVVSHNDNLLPVPNRDGQLPEEFPASIVCLAVAGNEMLADGTLNSWNKRKSIDLLRFYSEDDATDDEDEQSSSSRRRRLRVA